MKFRVCMLTRTISNKHEGIKLQFLNLLKGNFFKDIEHNTMQVHVSIHNVLYIIVFESGTQEMIFF